MRTTYSNQRFTIIMVVVLLASLIGVLMLSDGADAITTWVTPTGHNEGGWYNEEKAYNENNFDNSHIKVSNDTPTPFVELTHSGVDGDGIRFYLNSANNDVMNVTVGVKYDGSWHTLAENTSSINWGDWTEFSVGSQVTMTGMRVKYYASSGTDIWCYVQEADFKSVHFAPSVNFTVEPSEPQPTYTDIYFNSTSSDSDGSIVNWTWQMGDGTTLYGENVTHSYDDDGIYPVNLSVEDDYGDTNATEKNIHVENIHPTPSFNYSPSEPTIIDIVEMNASESYDSDGTIVNYTWNLGNEDIRYGETIEYIYPYVGFYTINLTVTDNDGNTSSTSQNITLLNPSREGTMNQGLITTWWMVFALAAISLFAMLIFTWWSDINDQKKGIIPVILASLSTILWFVDATLVVSAAQYTYAFLSLGIGIISAVLLVWSIMNLMQEQIPHSHRIGDTR